MKFECLSLCADIILESIVKSHSFTLQMYFQDLDSILLFVLPVKLVGR